MQGKLTPTGHHSVEFAFNVQLRMLGVDIFELDGHLFLRANIRT